MNRVNCIYTLASVKNKNIVFLTNMTFVKGDKAVFIQEYLNRYREYCNGILK